MERAGEGPGGGKFKAIYIITSLGLIHTRHFCTQYCDIAIRKHFDFSIEQPQIKVLYVLLRAYLG